MELKTYICANYFASKTLLQYFYVYFILVGKTSKHVNKLGNEFRERENKATKRQGQGHIKNV